MTLCESSYVLPESPQGFTITPKVALELPEGVTGDMSRKTIYPREHLLADGSPNVSEPISMSLQPFEVVLIELSDQKDEP